MTPLCRRVRCWLIVGTLAVLLPGTPGAAEDAAKPEAETQAPAPDDTGRERAGNPEGSTTPARATDKPGNGQPDEAAGSGDKPGRNPDVFVPTEEISEDFAVPLPVDI